jgi:DNA-binding transcriptional LysR family regulator
MHNFSDLNAENVFGIAMNLRSLKYFSSVAETGSISAAADLVHRSQPAVSRAIQELEEDLGVELFTRNGRRVTLSPQGWSLLRDVKLVLEHADALTERARLLAAGKSLVLRIGAATSSIERVLPRLIQQFQSEWPNVELSLATGSGGGLLDALHRGEVDVVFTRQTASDTLASRALFPFHVIAVVPERHALASRKFVTIDDVVRHGLLIAPQDFTSRMLFDAACKASELRARFLLESHDQNALVALSEVGYGVAIMPSTIALEHHKVKALPIRSGKLYLGVWTALVFDKLNASAHVKAFIELAARRLKSDYPGALLKLPPLPR